MKMDKKRICILLACLIVVMLLVFTSNLKVKDDSILDTLENSIVDEKTEINIDELKSKYTDTIQMLEEAKSENADTIAWLTVPGTDINNQVMQTSNNEDYLRHNKQGEYDEWGEYFADYYAVLDSPYSLIQNTVIYGHSENLKLPENPDGRKFSQLFRYTQLDFMIENPYIFLTVVDEILVFEIFAVFYTDIEFYYINPYLNNSGFELFINDVCEKNEYIYSNLDVTDQDKILTLSTCSNKYDINDTSNQRFVVMAKLLEDDFIEEKDITINENAVHPLG